MTRLNRAPAYGSAASLLPLSSARDRSEERAVRLSWSVLTGMNWPVEAAPTPPGLWSRIQRAGWPGRSQMTVPVTPVGVGEPRRGNDAYLRRNTFSRSRLPVTPLGPLRPTQPPHARSAAAPAPPAPLPA